MRTINGFAALSALALLGGDAMAGASIGKVALHIALLVINLVFYMAEER